MERSKHSVFVRSYWNYYLELEDQFLKTKKYVEFDLNNKNTYSIEYLKLMQAVCSEIDVVAKAIAIALDPTFVDDYTTGIQKWGFVLQKKMPNILTTKVKFYYDIEVCPWGNWEYEKYKDSKERIKYRLVKGKKTPEWWIAYNSVKHHRTKISDENGTTNYSKANLQNLINCFAALFILETEFLLTQQEEQELDIIVKKSQLFHSDNLMLTTIFSN